MDAVTGVFGTLESAERVRRLLIADGVRPERITLSRPISEDPLAGEWLGQSYENQPGQGSGGDASDEAKYNEAVRSGVCVLSVDIDADLDAAALEQALRDAGARETARR
jgi:hypothetical protein